MLDFTKLWEAEYLLGAVPVDLMRSDLIFFWATGILLVLAVGTKIYSMIKLTKGSPNHLLFAKFFHAFLTIGILALLWAGARYQSIPWLSTRILILVIWAAFLVWLGFIGRYYFQKFGKAHQKWQEEAQRDKYLP